MTIEKEVIIDIDDGEINLGNAIVTKTSSGRIQVLMSEKLTPGGSDEFIINLKRKEYDLDLNALGSIE